MRWLTAAGKLCLQLILFAQANFTLTRESNDLVTSNSLWLFVARNYRCDDRKTSLGLGGTWTWREFGANESPFVSLHRFELETESRERRLMKFRGSFSGTWEPRKHPKKASHTNVVFAISRRSSPLTQLGQLDIGSTLWDPPKQFFSPQKLGKFILEIKHRKTRSV